LKNFAAEQPYQHAVYYLVALLAEQAWLKEELLEATTCKHKRELVLFVKNYFFSLFSKFLLVLSTITAHINDIKHIYLIFL